MTEEDIPNIDFGTGKLIETFKATIRVCPNEDVQIRVEHHGKTVAMTTVRDRAMMPVIVEARGRGETDSDSFRSTLTAYPDGDVEIHLYHEGKDVAMITIPDSGMMPLIDAARDKIHNLYRSQNSTLGTGENVVAIVRGPDGKIKPPGKNIVRVVG